MLLSVGGSVWLPRQGPYVPGQLICHSWRCGGISGRGLVSDGVAKLSQLSRAMTMLSQSRCKV
jgi:hypothetical protein